MTGVELLDRLEEKFNKQLRLARKYLADYGDSYEEAHEWFRQFIKGEGVDIASGNFPTDEGMLNADGCYRLGNMANGFLSDVDDLVNFDSNHLDFVLCNYLDGFDQTLKALNEWNRVLKPGGTLAVMACNAEFVEYERNSGPMSNPRRVVAFTPLTMQRYLERAGFVDVKVDTEGKWIRASATKA